MPFRGLVDEWNASRERGDLVIGREGSARMDVELSKAGTHIDTPDPGPRSPGLLDWINDLLAGPDHREAEADPDEVEP